MNLWSKGRERFNIKTVINKKIPDHLGVIGEAQKV